jgi:hypothetical protein
MRTGHRFLMTLAGLLVLIGRLQVLPAEDQPAADDPQEETKKLSERIEKSIGWYEVLPDISAKAALRPRPVIRWRNAARGQDGEAMMVVWAHNGRPVAMASIYPWDGYMCHEFGSLSRQARLVARDGSAVAWSPNAPGLEFKNVPDAPTPGDTPAVRLRQMKSIAERFKGTMTGWKGDNSDREELRLLLRPLYRYELKESKETNPNLHDGALFAFVMGTDPEIVLVLEAVGAANEAVWQYAFARATSGGLEAKLDGAVVWTAEKFPATRLPTNPQVTLRRPLEE